MDVIEKMFKNAQKRQEKEHKRNGEAFMGYVDAMPVYGKPSKRGVCLTPEERRALILAGEPVPSIVEAGVLSSKEEAEFRAHVQELVVRQRMKDAQNEGESE